jgi:hypothetical protein
MFRVSMSCLSPTLAGVDEVQTGGPFTIADGWMVYDQKAGVLRNNVGVPGEL